MILEIERLLSKIIETIPFKDIPLFIDKYDQWFKCKQNLIGFNAFFRFKEELDQSLNQFYLESVLSIVMKLSLLPENEFNVDLQKMTNFGKGNISQIIFEDDFYTWINNIKDKEVIKLLSKLANLLKSYDKPTFNDLYEMFFSGSGRKSRGQYYTELDLSKFILKCSQFTNLNKNEIRVLDPACGAGSFIVASLDYFKEQNKIDNLILIGIDISYFACLMTRISYFKWWNKYNKIKKIDFIPIFWMDFLIDYGNPFLSRNIILPRQFEGSNSSLETYAYNYYNSIKDEGFDIIIGNPPYIRIQNIDKELRKLYEIRFESTTGRYDIYVLFLEKSLNLIREDGKIAFICSNKFMTANYGSGIRNFLVQNSEIERIYDFSDTKLFSAMILPCIIVYSRLRNKKSKLQYTLLTLTNQQPYNEIYKQELWKILEYNFDKDFETIIEIDSFNSNVKNRIAIKSFIENQPTSSKSWYFLPKEIRAICYKIEKTANFLLKDIAKINVGIKTTCDEVFIFKNEVPFKEITSLNKVHLIIKGSQISRWQINIDKEKYYILYPYEKKRDKQIPINLDVYPEIKEYFERNRIKLESREYIRDSTRKWFEIWVPLTADLFEKGLKIVVPDIATTNKFVLDENNYYCKGSCYIIKTFEEDKEFYYFLVGYLNSKAMEFYHKATLTTMLYSKRCRYMFKQLTQYPIVDLRNNMTTLYSIIIDYVKKIIKCNSKKTTMNLENELNNLVYSIFSLTQEEIILIENFLKI